MGCARCLRYFHAAGADPQARLGERHEPESHLIPLVLQAASGRRAGIDVFGRDYPTADGTCVRDYIHVVDLCEAHLAALERLRAGAPSRAYNLGNGNGFSVDEVIACAERVAGTAIARNYAPRRAGDAARLVADSRLARDELKWQPRFDDLATIIRHAWGWERRVCERRA
jgi:UDP-glucose 4-epimerase